MYPSGKGALCKSVIQRFESAHHLHFSQSDAGTPCPISIFWIGIAVPDKTKPAPVTRAG